MDRLTRTIADTPYDQLPTTVRVERDGQNPVEQLAVGVVQREVAAMPASLVVQLALWPDEVATWARETRCSESLVYNMLAGRKPYSRTRASLGERLGVPTTMVDHLIEAARPQPRARAGPDGWTGETVPGPDERTTLPPIDWRLPPFPRRRDATNPIERRAVAVVAADVASMPAATVVGLAIWPESLAAWSRAERLKSSVVWATLAGSPSAPVRDALARRLGVSLRALDLLVTRERAVPSARRPRPAPSQVASADAPAMIAEVTPRPTAPNGEGATSAIVDAQLGFGF